MEKKQIVIRGRWGVDTFAGIMDFTRNNGRQIHYLRAERINAALEQSRSELAAIFGNYKWQVKNVNGGYAVFATWRKKAWLDSEVKSTPRAALYSFLRRNIAWTADINEIEACRNRSRIA